MKRIILGLSLLLMLVQNGFAKTDAEWDKEIANRSDKAWEQIYRCNKEAINHKYDGDVNVCLKAVELSKNKGDAYAIMLLNTGAMYISQGDKLKAYQYYMKAAKLGETTAQSNLSIMCKQDPWVCK